jgi:hypothetical protein
LETKRTCEDETAERRYLIILSLAVLCSITMMTVASWYLPRPLYLTLYAIILTPSTLIMSAVILSGREPK